MIKTATALAEKVLLRGDNGAELEFKGRIFSESSYYDEETSTLTRLRLFMDEDGRHVYSIISGSGANKNRRFYIVVPGKDVCEISDGIHTLTVPIDMLFAAVFGLCGIDPSRADELRPSFEEGLSLATATM